MSCMEAYKALPFGQQEARKRWGTHESGAAFDRKKTTHLTEQAQTFIAHQPFCVIAGPGPENELCGLITVGTPGFAGTPDRRTCLLQLDPQFQNARIIQRLRQFSHAGRDAQLGLFFICHPTRERLCVQGIANLLPYHLPVLHRLFAPPKEVLVCLRVRQAFFHCAKYIKTRVVGLTTPVTLPPEQLWRPADLLGRSQSYLSEEMQAFIAEQVLCFLCTIDQHGQCAVNHRGGASGFLLALPPDNASPGGTILLPDYAGNGAFEAIGNILETGQAALVIPNYAAQLALCISGTARIVELDELSTDLAQSCIGAERVVALSVQRVETQCGDWSTALAYERARAEALSTSDNLVVACPV
jgi:uncharacterized protein